MGLALYTLRLEAALKQANAKIMAINLWTLEVSNMGKAE